MKTPFSPPADHQIDWQEWQKRLHNLQQWRHRQARRQAAQETEYTLQATRAGTVVEEFFQWCAPPGNTLLDIGCGAGWNKRLLDNYAYIGIDPLRVSPREQFLMIQGVGEYLPFRDGTFDCVVITAALDHVASIHHTFAESRRVLRPGGVFCLLTGAEDGITTGHGQELHHPPTQSSSWAGIVAKMTKHGISGLLNSLYYRIYYSRCVKSWLNNTHVRLIYLRELHQELSTLGFIVECVQSRHDQVFFLKARHG